MTEEKTTEKTKKHATSEPAAPLASHVICHGRISRTRATSYEWGSVRTLMSDYGAHKATALNITFKKTEQVPYSSWAGSNESICVVESGSGDLLTGGTSIPLKRGMAFCVPLNKDVQKNLSIKSSEEENLVLTSLQLPCESTSREPSDAKVQIVDPSKTAWKIFEYEALGKEVLITPSRRMGVLQLAFPIEQIPLHIHPQSDRFIRTIAGQGFVYVDPFKYDLGADDAYIAFPKGQIHTNGPRPGNWWQIWSFHYPWVDPQVDEENVGGSEAYAKYLNAPPKALWKSKEELVFNLPDCLRTTRAAIS